MENKNIDLVIDSLGMGGAERICVNYANHFSSKGYKVRIIVFNNVQSSYLNLLDDNVKLIVVNCNNSFSLYLNLKKMNFIFANSVIAFNHQIAVSLWLYNRTSGNYKFKIIARNVNYLSEDLYSRKNSIKKYLTIILVKLLYNKMDGYIAQCLKMKTDMEDFLSVDKDRIRVIYNPVSDRIYSKGLMKKKYDILFVGRLSVQKGVEYLVDIMKQVEKLHRDSFTLCVIGNGDLKQELITNLNKIQSDKINKFNFIHYDKVDNINDFYNDAKLLILTSRYEGYPNVLVESLVAKTPVISFDCNSGPSEIIRDNINGFLIPTFNTTVFSKRIVDVLEGYQFSDVSCSNGSDSMEKLERFVDDVNY